MHLVGGALERTLRLLATPICGAVVATSATASVNLSLSVYLVFSFVFVFHGIYEIVLQFTD
eukprot:COSAG02_NODE_7378_length_3042_cov_3.182127_2_plen_61_part_00